MTAAVTREKTIKIQVLRCERCGYEWVPRVLPHPKRCPRCGAWLTNKKEGDAPAQVPSSRTGAEPPSAGDPQ